MARLMFNERTVSNWTPTSYTSDQTDTVIGVSAGDYSVGDCIIRTRVVFNGSGTAAKIIVGDGDDPNGYCADGDIDETTVGIGRGAGAYFSTNPKLYTTDDTIDIGFTANTSGGRTTGNIDLAVYIAKVDPH